MAFVDTLTDVPLTVRWNGGILTRAPLWINDVDTSTAGAGILRLHATGRPLQRDAGNRSATGREPPALTIDTAAADVFADVHSSAARRMRSVSAIVSGDPPREVLVGTGDPTMRLGAFASLDAARAAARAAYGAARAGASRLTIHGPLSRHWYAGPALDVRPGRFVPAEIARAPWVSDKVVHIVTASTPPTSTLTATLRLAE